MAPWRFAAPKGGRDFTSPRPSSRAPSLNLRAGAPVPTVSGHTQAQAGLRRQAEDPAAQNRPAHDRGHLARHRRPARPFHPRKNAPITSPMPAMLQPNRIMLLGRRPHERGGLVGVCIREARLPAYQLGRAAIRRAAQLGSARGARASAWSPGSPGRRALRVRDWHSGEFPPRGCHHVAKRSMRCHKTQ
jgi:hypothetical protein